MATVAIRATRIKKAFFIRHVIVLNIDINVSASRPAIPLSLNARSYHLGRVVLASRHVLGNDRPRHVLDIVLSHAGLLGPDARNQIKSHRE